MNTLFMGDMATSMRTMRLTSQIKNDFERYTYEVASGNKQDVSRAVSGDFSPLASIERSLRTLNAFDLSIQEASLFSSAVQTSLTSISAHVDDVSVSLITASITSDPTSTSAAAADARSRFDAVISALNARMGDRSLFSGAATGNTALVSADEMLSDINSRVAGATTPDEVELIVEDWFLTSAGHFETLAYKGSATNLSSFALGDHDHVDLQVTAMNKTIRDTLKGFAMASLVDEGIFAGEPQNQSALLKRAGTSLMGSMANLTDLRAEVGLAEARIDEAATANKSMVYSFEQAKSKIVSADPYEASSLLKQTETQLEIVYTLTARMSRLNLADYLR